MAIWLTDLANWLRDAGLTVREYQGWQTRARSSGGYSAMPLCVMWHHTASGSSWDGQRDADYIATGDPNSPLSNLYIDRSGTVWVLAAGATNTNGKGGPLTFSRGTVPVDGMNTRALGVEMGNNGVGEPWPVAQVNAMFLVSNTCNRHFGNQPGDISSHNRWAPTRKIDPATAYAVQGPWCPRSVNSSGTWSDDDMRQECQRRWDSGATPEPLPPDTGDDDMLFDGLWKRDNHFAVHAIYKNGTKMWLETPESLEAFTNLQRLNGANETQLTIREQTSPAMFAAFGVVIGPVPPGCDPWGNPL